MEGDAAKVAAGSEKPQPASQPTEQPPSRSVLPAIFIHAGAGYHSHQNEKLHLQACNDAAVIGIRFLRAGSSATEAIEASVKLLEDREITNAGYGSNLTIDGTVECDATIVDHRGRSGACGAVPNVRNPICLAKLILDQSSRPLTLRRVPPNFLVGPGARDFARRFGMALVANDGLVSKNARDRFLRWQEDLRRAEIQLAQEALAEGVKSSDQGRPDSAPPTVLPEGGRAGSSQQPDHTNAILTATWNEGQPDSPGRGSPAPASESPEATQPGGRATPARGAEKTPQGILASLAEAGGGGGGGGLSLPFMRMIKSPKPAKPVTVLGTESPRPDLGGAHESHRDGSTSPPFHCHHADPAGSAAATVAAAAANSYTATPEVAAAESPRGFKRTWASYCEAEGDLDESATGHDDGDDDRISDTVGAIAIDQYGRIAAGSSSGGIGMKHAGRIGPAALVGIGTVVIPWRDQRCDPKSDEPGITVAAVTSGTGEHMAVSMAALRCAGRLYSNTMMGQDGSDQPARDDNEILHCFIRDDFVRHPGVVGSTAVGAIGVMAVKLTATGAYLHFVHDTDSFALASMGGRDKEPRCVMSRGKAGSITAGGRRVSVE